MSLTLHNTATKRTEEFIPLRANSVRIYTCGPTVYDYPHIGNWAAYIYWDTLIRTLCAYGYAVERTMNITDVGHLVSDSDEGEDKLEKGARREGKSAWDIAEFYTEDFVAGMEKLGLLTPEHIARATDYIPEQLDLVRSLRDKGYTYQISDGIYFNTSKFPRYGDFAGLDLDELMAGARVEANPEKHNPSDFALWKFTPRGTRRDMEWETPADLLDNNGHVATQNDKQSVMGFPGWHVECSAIAMHFFGPTLDIHTGGIDHIPVHHTNEIAQSEAATGKLFSRYWLHNNHLKVDGTKISKSLGNGYTLQDLEDKGFSPLDFRLLVLQSHYQSEGNFTFEGLTAAKNRRNHWRSIAALRWQQPDMTTASEAVAHTLTDAAQTLQETLGSNLNTPEALRLIDETFSHLEQCPRTDIPTASLTLLLNTVDELLGLQLVQSTPDIDDAAKHIVSEREEARINRDWKTSDALRDKLTNRGISVKDTPEGSVWSYT